VDTNVSAESASVTLARATELIERNRPVRFGGREHLDGDVHEANLQEALSRPLVVPCLRIELLVDPRVQHMEGHGDADAAFICRA
jgi:hypothetical protein